MTPSKTLTLSAPAKLNLFLHVVGRRADGYHLLESLMGYVDFGDMLTLTLRADELVVLKSPIPGVADEDDLCFRAAMVMRVAHQAKRGLPAPGLDIALAKRIPMGAGLGGGSSDAASVLMGYNALLGRPFSRKELQDLGLQLGADVPFFIFGRSALARGVGEKLLPVTLPAIPVWIVVPPVHISTPSIFKDAELSRDTALLSQDCVQLNHGRNDLQPVACRLHPAVGELIGQWPQSRMSGSGSAVFGFSPPPGVPDVKVFATSLRDRHSFYSVEV